MKAVDFISRHPSGSPELDRCLLDYIESYEDEFLSFLLEEEAKDFEGAYNILLLSFLLDDENDDEEDEGFDGLQRNYLGQLLN